MHRPTLRTLALATSLALSAAAVAAETASPAFDVSELDRSVSACADFDAYWEAQARVEAHWHDSKEWWRSAVLNTARMGWFSSDRTIREYATEIWKALD